MNIARLLQTTAVKLALRYVLVYALLLGATLGVLLWSSNRYIDSQLTSELEQELHMLTRIQNEQSVEHLLKTLIRLQERSLQDGRIYLYVSSEGAKIAGNLLAWPADTEIALDGKVRSVWVEEEVIPVELYDDDAYWPVAAKEFSDGRRLFLARHVTQDKGLQDVTEYLIEVLAVAMLLSLAMGVTLGRTILGRMDTISRTASEIMAGDLARRVPVSNRNDEFDALAQRLNSMLDRIQQLIKGIREVTDNIAHDLRSPLTRLRSRLEVTLLEERSDTSYRAAVSDSIEDVESLIKTFNALLKIAQAEAGNHRSEWRSIDLSRLASDLTDFYRPVAEENQQTLKFHAAENVEISGSQELVSQAIGNLLENAIKYTPQGGLISIQVTRLTDAVELTVSDTGLGIPESEREHVLERFVRLENVRNTPGNGLGLSLVKAVAGLHRAELRLGDANPGLTVSLRFARRST